MSEDVTVAVTRETITITADNGDTVTVSDPQVTVVTDQAPADSAAASAAAAAASAVAAGAAIVTALASGLYPASFTSLLASDHMVLASTKKLYLDGVGGVGGDSYIVHSASDVVDHYAGGVNALRLTAAGAAVTGTLSATGQSTFSQVGDASNATVQLANSTQNLLECYASGASADQKRWGWQSGSAVGDGTIRLRAINDARTNGINAISISRSGIASVALTFGGAATFESSCQLPSGNNLTWGGTYGAGIPTIVGVSGASAYVAVYPSGTTGGETLRVVSNGNLGIVATAKAFLDGVNCLGDTYLVESSANVLDVYSGGTKSLSLAGRNVFIDGATGVLSGGASYTGYDGVHLKGTNRSYLTRSASDYVIDVDDISAGANIGYNAFQRALYKQDASTNVVTYTFQSTATGAVYATPLTLKSTGEVVVGTVSTTDPAGGAGPAWKLGVAAAVSPTAPNRTLRVDIAGTSYYLAAKTTND